MVEHERMAPEDIRAKAQGLVFARLERARMRAAAVALLKPLIVKASVTKKMRDEVLATPASITAEDFDEDVREIAVSLLDEMLKGKLVTEPKTGRYALAADPPHLTVREAREYGKVLLKDWPEEAREEILRVFNPSKHSEPDEHEKED